MRLLTAEGNRPEIYISLSSADDPKPESTLAPQGLSHGTLPCPGPATRKVEVQPSLHMDGLYKQTFLFTTNPDGGSSPRSSFCGRTTEQRKTRGLGLRDLVLS